MALFRRKSDKLNNQPYDQNATPEQKAAEFDRQYQQNRKFTDTPALDAKEGKATRKKGKHRK